MAAARWMDTHPWGQIVLFVVLCILLALPIYTSVPQGWASVGVVLWAAVLLVLIGPRWPKKGGRDDR